MLLGCAALEFRRRYNGEGMLERMRNELILPYRETLMAFQPLNAPPQWYTTPRSMKTTATV
jgi:hypothetical protein